MDRDEGGGAARGVGPSPDRGFPRRSRVVAVQRASAPETIKADWTAFVAWCEDQGLAALPADPATVAGFLRVSAEKLSPGARSRRAAAIGNQHRRRGLGSPAADPTVKAILRDTRRAATRRRRSPGGITIGRDFAIRERPASETPR